MKLLFQRNSHDTTESHLLQFFYKLQLHSKPHEAKSSSDHKSRNLITTKTFRTVNQNKVKVLTAHRSLTSRLLLWFFLLCYLHSRCCPFCLHSLFDDFQLNLIECLCVKISKRLQRRVMWPLVTPARTLAAAFWTSWRIWEPFRPPDQPDLSINSIFEHELACRNLSGWSLKGWWYWQREDRWTGCKDEPQEASLKI